MFAPSPSDVAGAGALHRSAGVQTVSSAPVSPVRARGLHALPPELCEDIYGYLLPDDLARLQRVDRLRERQVLSPRLPLLGRRVLQRSIDVVLRRPQPAAELHASLRDHLRGVGEQRAVVDALAWTEGLAFYCRHHHDKHCTWRHALFGGCLLDALRETCPSFVGIEVHKNLLSDLAPAPDPYHLDPSHRNTPLVDWHPALQSLYSYRRPKTLVYLHSRLTSLVRFNAAELEKFDRVDWALQELRSNVVRVRRSGVLTQLGTEFGSARSEIRLARLSERLPAQYRESFAQLCASMEFQSIASEDLDVFDMSDEVKRLACQLQTFVVASHTSADEAALVALLETPEGQRWRNHVTSLKRNLEDGRMWWLGSHIFDASYYDEFATGACRRALG